MWQVPLNRVRSLGLDGRGPFSEHSYPSYITDELLELPVNFIEGQSGLHANGIMEEFGPIRFRVDACFNAHRKARGVISRLRTPASLS